TTITTTGEITSTYLEAISAQQGATTTGDLVITSTNVSSRAGILASNQGSGALTISTSGTVTGTGSTGIYALQGTNALGDLSISVADIQSYGTAIMATNNGSGSTRITATGTVVGDTEAGIVAIQGATAGDLVVQAADVSANYNAIATRNEGTGGTTITTTGEITSTYLEAISAQQGATT
ncbi:MAG: hypothetical protein AAGK79_21040, partial [Pseudomonadota bacterium]